MNRRSFLTALGFAPVVAAGGAVAAKANATPYVRMKAGDLDSEAVIEFRDGRLTLSAANLGTHIAGVVKRTLSDPRRV